MGYSIELSFDLSKHKNYSAIKNFIHDEAEKYGAESFYDFFEIEGSKRIDRNRSVFSVYFEEAENCLKFSKVVNRTKFLDIEIIYDDCHKIIFASSYYRRNKMTHEARKNYKQQVHTGAAQTIRNYLQK